jgi:hypothetical protein
MLRSKSLTRRGRKLARHAMPSSPLPRPRTRVRGRYWSPVETPSIQPEPAPVRIENTRTIEIELFIPNGQLDPRYYNSPYYIMPRDEVGQEAFAVIRDAMARKDVVGLGHVILSKRERPIMIASMAQGLCGLPNGTMIVYAGACSRRTPPRRPPHRHVAPEKRHFY